MSIVFVIVQFARLSYYFIYFELFCSDIDVIAKKLHHLSQQSGYNIQQQHGQRIYGGPPPDWTGPPPERGTEVGLEDAFQL